jgi:hypothetical protein
LSKIEERIAARNAINGAQMRQTNAAIPAEVYNRGKLVSLLIPKQLRLAGEFRRIYGRVVQHTRAGYQLVTQ